MCIILSPLNRISLEMLEDIEVSTTALGPGLDSISFDNTMRDINQIVNIINARQRKLKNKKSTF